MVRIRLNAISVIVLCALCAAARSEDIDCQICAEIAELESLTASIQQACDALPPDLAEHGEFGHSAGPGLVVPASGSSPAGDDSAKFPRAYQIPGTDVWWKFGGYIKGDFIHDFEPAGETDRFVPTTIPTDGFGGQNTLMQAKATRLNLDVRAPSDWGVVRGFVETDFFNDDAQLRIRHAYVEVDCLLAGQTWSVFTDPNGIPRTLDFESPIAFITQRQAQFRFTEQITDDLKWAFSIENPTTTVDDIVTTTIPGQPEQPIPDLVTHLKYKTDVIELFWSGLFRDLVYQPDVGPAQERFGWATNFVGILYPTNQDKLIGQIVFGDGLGRYRSGSDLGLVTPTTVDAVSLLGGCAAIEHQWTETLSSTGTYSFAYRRGTDVDPPDTLRYSNYLAINLIWEFIENTTMGVEYLYGNNEEQGDAFGYANRIQASVQYNFP